MPCPAKRFIVAQAWPVAQVCEGRVVAHCAGVAAEGALLDEFELLRGPLQHATLAAGSRLRPAPIGALTELKAFSIDIQTVRRGGGLPRALAFQHAVLQGWQTRPAYGAAPEEGLREHASQQAPQINLSVRSLPGPLCIGRTLSPLG